MKQVLFLVTGSWRPEPKSKLDFKELAVTGPNTGTVNYSDCMKLCGAAAGLGSQRIATNQPYIIAAHVTGKVAADDDAAGQRTADAAAGQSRNPRGRRPGAKENNINVVLVADIDWIAPIIFLRPRDGRARRDARRLEIPKRDVRAQHARFAGGRRPLRRDPQANSAAPHPDEDRRSDGRLSEGVAGQSRPSSSTTPASRSTR